MGRPHTGQRGSSSVGTDISGVVYPVYVADMKLLDGLKEVKEMLDGAPTVIKNGISKAEAETIKADLEKIGAKVTLK